MSQAGFEHRVFFQQFLKNFQSTGAISPSSRWLAAALARYVREGQGPRRVLEVGPGTGAVTREIVTALQPDDQLDLVELNQTFVEHLQRRFEAEPPFAAVAARARVLHQRLEELPPEPSYDVVISGLPLNNFPAADVRQILELLRGLLRPAGTLSFFEYIAVRPARALVSRADERQRLRAVGQVLDEVLRPFEIRREWIWPNVPPAWVHHVRFT